MFSGVASMRAQARRETFVAKGEEYQPGCVRVEFNYDPQYQAELSLRKGDLIKDVVESDDGWWSGLLNGKLGIFPSNYVKRLYPYEFSVRAEWDYDGSAEVPPFKELKFLQGEVFLVDDKDIESHGEWWHGVKISTKGKCEEGWFPARFVQPFNTGLAAIAPKPPSADSKNVRKKEKDAKTTVEPKSADAVGHVNLFVYSCVNLKKKASKKMTAQVHVGVLEGDPKSLRSIFCTKEVKGDNSPVFNEIFELNVAHPGKADLYIVVREGKKSMGSLTIPIEEQMCGGYSKEEKRTGRLMKLQGKDSNGSIKVVIKYTSYTSKPSKFHNKVHMGQDGHNITWQTILEMAGLKPEDLKNPKIALAVQAALGQYQPKSMIQRPQQIQHPQHQGGAPARGNPYLTPTAQGRHLAPPPKPAIPINGVRGSTIVPRNAAPMKPSPCASHLARHTHQQPPQGPPVGPKPQIKLQQSQQPPQGPPVGPKPTLQLSQQPPPGPPVGPKPTLQPQQPQPPPVGLKPQLNVCTPPRADPPPPPQKEKMPVPPRPGIRIQAPSIQVEEEEDYGPPPDLPPRDEARLPQIPARNTNVMRFTGKELSKEEQQKKAEREKIFRERLLKEEREREQERLKQEELREQERREQEEWERLAREEQERLEREEQERWEREEQERLEAEAAEIPPPLPARDDVVSYGSSYEESSSTTSFMMSLKEQREKMKQKALEREKQEQEEGEMALPEVETMEEASSIAALIRNAMNQRSLSIQGGDDESSDDEEW